MGDGAKALGAFYTDAQIADFLVWWAVRYGTDTVLDPSFGGGAFLRSACFRLLELGERPASHVFGIEIDERVLGTISEKLVDEFGLRRSNLLLSDFFDVTPEIVPCVDVVVGNPPFIRYQRFKGAVRHNAIKRAEEEGVRLSRLSSSWAPFLVHSARMLKEGGRLAMVVPMEIGHASYAKPILKYLWAKFGEVTFLTFRKKLFPSLSEDTLLLLAERKGDGPARLYTRDLSHSGSLGAVIRCGRRSLAGRRRLSEGEIEGGRARLIEYVLPRIARELYQHLKRQGIGQPLGKIADVGIGYVTGSNDFFHLTPERVTEWSIPDRFLKRAVRRGRSLQGLRFTGHDWRNALPSGEAGYLLFVEGAGGVPRELERYIRHGEREGVSKTFKCRTRNPWYAVPHVHLPDAFLSYMSGDTPRLVANDARVYAPNSLHVLRLHPGTRVTSDALAAIWFTSLTRLSTEIEGHPLGGGLLKLEPTEAENVVVPYPEKSNGELTDLARELDEMVRRGTLEKARARADRVVLKGYLGLDERDISVLRDAARELHHRRNSRSTLT